jgi:hypothetical protein
MKDEKTIVIDINLTQGLVGLLALALLLAALLGYLAWGQDEVAASGSPAPLASSAGMRQYYLTTSTHAGNEAAGSDGNGAGVCADGYHFASFWEILDPASLKYNTSLGCFREDSGQGPPSDRSGWVRTGYSNSFSVWGRANCRVWASDDDGDSGTLVYLPSTWTTGQHIHVWNVGMGDCDDSYRVWCVED